MSKFFSKKFGGLTPYTPGEQPSDMKYIKLNTNESPYPVSEEVAAAVAAESGKLQLYSDPECAELRENLAEVLGVGAENLVMTNGSDEVLNLAFMAFADNEKPLLFPDITYGFYPVFAKLNNIPYKEAALQEDFSIKTEDYENKNNTVVIANPNAPTGLCLTLGDIEKIVASNKKSVVIIDEAYVDFGAESAVSLIGKYDNLFVTQTFSKSRSMAGARLGFGIASRNLIDDINTLRYSTNPYNVNRLTEAAGRAVLKNNEYYMENCRKIVKTRQWTTKKLREMGFEVLDSHTNFVFAKSDKISGADLYSELKKRGILVRHFDRERISEYNRITIGTMEQMRIFAEITKDILSGV